MAAATVAEIDPAAIAHNLGRVRALAPDARVMGVVKADAYGHGVGTVVDVLGGADALGVATVAEAQAVRRLGYAGRVCVMSRLACPEDLAVCASAHLWPVLHDMTHIDWLERLADPGRLAVWLKLDSGMHRLGLRADDVAAAYRRVRDAGCRVGLMTHLASADDPASSLTAEQIAHFTHTCQGLDVEGNGRYSIANSAGIVGHPGSHADWVRPGIMLYGASPMQGVDAASFDLRPAMTLRAPVISVRSHQAGEAVGYSQTWRSDRDTRLAVIGCGYADGYPRHAPSGTPVLIGGVRYPLAGRVSMDTIVVDVGLDARVDVGSMATLWGSGLAVEEIARSAGTIAYELLTRLSPRVPRHVVTTGAND